MLLVEVVNIPEPNTSNFEADRNYASKLCKDTFDLDVKILKVFRLGMKVPNKYRPLLVHFNNENCKAKILGKSYLLKSMEPYSSIYVSADMTKSERIMHRQLVEELKSRRARGETNIFIRGNSIIAISPGQIIDHQAIQILLLTRLQWSLLPDEYDIYSTTSLDTDIDPSNLYLVNIVNDEGHTEDISLSTVNNTKIVLSPPYRQSKWFWKFPT